MDAKLFEVRDRMTMIPVLAVRFTPAGEQERWLLAHSGYGRTPEAQAGYVWVGKIATGATHSGTCDPFTWSSETMTDAHRHIAENWPSLESGAVIDCEFLRGERAEPRKSEREG